MSEQKSRSSSTPVRGKPRRVNDKHPRPASSPLDAEIDRVLDRLREILRDRVRELVDDAVLTERRELSRQLVTLAKLSSDTPQFDNPLRVWEAKTLRDEILGASQKGDRRENQNL